MKLKLYNYSIIPLALSSRYIIYFKNNCIFIYSNIINSLKYYILSINNYFICVHYNMN